MTDKYKESLYTKNTSEGEVRIPYSFPLPLPHQRPEDSSKAIREWNNLVKKMNK